MRLLRELYLKNTIAHRFILKSETTVNLHPDMSDAVVPEHLACLWIEVSVVEHTVTVVTLVSKLQPFSGDS